MAKKGGFHVNSLTPAARAALDVAVPAWVKFLEPVDAAFLRGLRSRNPDIRIVFRGVWDGAPVATIDQDTEATLRALDGAHGGVDEIVVEVPRNEMDTGVGDREALKRYVDATIPTLDRYAQHGFKVAVGAFGVGWPRLEDVDVLVPLLQAAAARGGYLALHEYWLPSDGLMPGQKNWSWWAGRYRRIWNLIREVAPIPILITECGIDGGLIDEHHGGQGWRNVGDPPNVGVTASVYAAQVRGYLQQLADDPFVHGMMLYCLDALDEQWAGFRYVGQPEILSVLTQPMGGRALWVPSPDAEVPPPASLAGAEPNPPPLSTGGVVVPPTPSALPWRGKILTVWNLPPDPQTLVAACRAAGMDGVEIKVADGDSPWLNPARHVTKDYVAALKAAGLRVLSWSYNYCDLVVNRKDGGAGRPEGECDAALMAVRALGVEGHTFDLEIECEGHDDLVAIMLDRATRTFPVPIAAHVWADLAGHGAYPADVIASYVDAIRPMIYRPVWDAPASYSSWHGRTAGKPFLPVWGITEGTEDQIDADMSVADREGAAGEAYWEYAALGQRPWLTAFLAKRQIGDTLPETSPTPEPPPPAPGFDVEAIRASLWGVKDQLAANGWPRFAQAIEAAVTQSKGER